MNNDCYATFNGSPGVLFLTIYRRHDLDSRYDTLSCTIEADDLRALQKALERAMTEPASTGD